MSARIKFKELHDLFRDSKYNQYPLSQMLEEIQPFLLQIDSKSSN